MSAPTENPTYPWYKVILPGDETAHQIEQGDILENFSTLSMIDPDQHPGNTLPLEQQTHDLIVLSQSCDLANSKINRVVTCPLLTIHDFPAEHPIAKKGGMEQLRKGNLTTFHLLNRCSLEGFERDWRIADFGEVVSIPLSLVRKHLIRAPHLRLLPPYREQLSQSFARVFMRVGLPLDIPKFT